MYFFSFFKESNAIKRRIGKTKDTPIYTSTDISYFIWSFARQINVIFALWSFGSTRKYILSVFRLHLDDIPIDKEHCHIANITHLINSAHYIRLLNFTTRLLPLIWWSDKDGNSAFSIKIKECGAWETAAYLRKQM